VPGQKLLQGRRSLSWKKRSILSTAESYTTDPTALSLFVSPFYLL